MNIPNIKQLYHLFQILNLMIIAHDFISILSARFWQQNREFILRFFSSQQQSTFLFLKIFLVADALARAGLGPGAAAPRPGGDPL